MTSLLLALVLAYLSPSTISAYFTWNQLSETYALAPLSLSWEPVVDQQADGMALFGGYDQQGRASVVFDSRMEHAPAELQRKILAHEAGHAMLRAQGIPYGGMAEENLVNSFAYCWVGDASYFPIRPCAEILAEFPHR